MTQTSADSLLMACDSDRGGGGEGRGMGGEMKIEREREECGDGGGVAVTEPPAVPRLRRGRVGRDEQLAMNL